MRGPPKHERRWASDTVPGNAKMMSAGSSPGTESSAAEEFVEVTLDLQDDDRIILRSVEPATVINIDNAVSVGSETPKSASVSRSPTFKRSSSNLLRQFSQELKAEAVAKARQFSQELKAELKRFSWSHGHSAGAGNGFDSALAARALRKRQAQLDRTRSGAHKALRGLRFISSKSNGVDAWNEIQSNFDKLAKDGYLYRSDFAQCIGSFVNYLIRNPFSSIFLKILYALELEVIKFLISFPFVRNERFKGVCSGTVRCFESKTKIEGRKDQ